MIPKHLRAASNARRKATREISSAKQVSYILGKTDGHRIDRMRWTKVVQEPDGSTVLGSVPEYPRYRVPIARNPYTSSLFPVDPGLAFQRIVCAEFEATQMALDITDEQKVVWWTWKRFA